MKYTLYLFLCVLLVFGCAVGAHAQIINTYAGNGTLGYTGDNGQATSARLKFPTSMALDASGNLYFTDQLNYCVRKVTPAGIITTVAGSGSNGFGGDGGPATAAIISDGWGVAVDAGNNIYITDQLNYRVRKVNAAGIISTIAGSATQGTAGDNGPATDAELSQPVGIAVDGSGNIYIGDQNVFTIRKISPSGIITRFAGTTGVNGYAGDGGQATNATFNHIYGLAADASGNVYVCDAENNCVRKINTLGIITTIAGTGTAGFSGDHGAATDCMLNHPTGVFAGPDRTILIADSYNQRVRKIDATGIITTIAGTGVPGFYGDGGLCTIAGMYYPTCVIADASRNIYITDFQNDRIRKIAMVLSYSSGHTHSLVICENAGPVSLDSSLAATDQATGLTDTWSLIPGYGPFHGTAHISYSMPASGLVTIPAGTYYQPNAGYAGNDTLKALVTNGIATDTETIYITVEPFLNNAGSISGDSIVCVGASITLTDTASGGLWAMTNLKAVVTGGIVTGESPGRDTITYTVANSCGQAVSTKAITVNALPGIGAIAGLSELCVGASITLTDTAAGGNWSAANGGVFLTPLINICQVNGLFPGKDTISYTITGLFCTAGVMYILTVDPLPAAAINGGIAELCAGAAITLTGAAAGGVWAISNGVASFGADNTGGVLTALTYGTDTLTYRVTNFCGTASAMYAFGVDTLPPRPLITRDESTLYVPPGYTTYQWLLDGSPIPGAIADSYALVNNGIYSVLVTNAGGCVAISDSLIFPGCGPGGLLVFPNPTEGMVNISWCQKVTARLFCMDGKLVHTFYNVTGINLGDLPNTDYLLTIYDESGNRVAVKHIVKLSK